MSYLRKFGLVVSAIAFCMSLYVASADAQWRQGSSSREYRSRTVYGDRYNSNRRYNRSRSVYWGQQSSRYGRLTPREYWRLQRQRSRIYRSTNRAYRDGYLNNRERRRLTRQQYRYRRNVYRDSRDW